MKSLIDAALGHSRTVILVLVFILISGSYAYYTIPKEAAPDVAIPIIYVSMSHEGISPEDADRLLVRPMSKELQSIEGVNEMRSNAGEGHASVVLEFDAGFDRDRAFQDAVEAVDKARNELPTDSDEPSVNEVNFALFPVVVVTLSGNVPTRALREIAQRLKEDIEALEPVLEADIAGDREEVLEIIIDPVVLDSYGISYEKLINFVLSNNRLIAAGALDTGSGRFSVKVPGLLQEMEDLLNLPVKVEGDNVVALRDVTSIRRGFKDPTNHARLNGRPAISLEVTKRVGENIIDTVEQVRKVVEESRDFWPQGIEVTFTQDQSGQIRTMLNDLQNNVISAVLLVMIVIIASLGLRSAGLVGVAITGSFLTGILI
ncbi:MAG: efflux RND transporter permease subunit, partial [Pseudomonadota bacterium]